MALGGMSWRVSSINPSPMRAIGRSVVAGRGGMISGCAFLRGGIWPMP